MEYIIKHKKTGKYVKRYFGSRWKLYINVKDAELFPSEEEAHNFLENHTSRLTWIKSNVPMTDREINDQWENILGWMDEGLIEHRPDFGSYEIVPVEVSVNET